MPLNSNDRTAVVRIMADRLLATQVEGICSHAELQRISGLSKAEYGYLVQTAIKLANDEAGAVYGTVRNVGYQRLPIERAATVGKVTRAKIKRASRRATTRMVNAMSRANNLPSDVKRGIDREINALQLIQHLTTEAAVTAVEVDRMQKGASPAQTTAGWLVPGVAA